MLVHFKAIARILTDKLFALRDLAFDSSLAYMFGFSFGARLITRAAIDFGPKEIGTIDCKAKLNKQFIYLNPLMC